MSEFNSIEEIAHEIGAKYEWETTTNNTVSSAIKNIIALYAFNGTWKTMLSSEFLVLNDYNESGDDDLPENTVRRVLCYNAFLEDLFSWDNQNQILTFEKNSWESKLIEEQGLQSKIIDNFKRFLNTKIEPDFDFIRWKVVFLIPTWNDNTPTNIKISRWEESIFIWTVFYTIVELVIEELNTKEEDRSTDLFNHLDYIVIDDPVSSIDDTKIITLAVELVELIKSDKEKKLKFLLTTHHPLFYNVFINSFKRNKIESLILKKTASWLELKWQWDSPFGYHLLVKKDIQNAINSWNIQKYHFNLFRWLLEKTSNFLWMNEYWTCIDWENKNEFLKLINLYSHNRLESMEYRDVTDESKELFKEKFEAFINKYNFN